jgi:hypothetical protein
MLHHDGKESYETASVRAMSWAKDKLNQLIDRGRESTKKVLEKVDATLIEDAIVRADRVSFYPGSEEGTLCMEANGFDALMHEHAADQAIARLGGSKRITQWAFQPDTAEEFAGILNKKIKQQGSKRYLTRSVTGQVRGFMSDRYRRLDVRPLVESLVSTSVSGYGAVPIDAHVLETSFHMKLVLPRIFEPITNEVGVFGLTFRNSDFGAGRLYIKGFFNRLWCTNLAMCEDGISQVHLGRVLSDDIAFSQRTYELDTMTMASAIGDVVKHIFSAENIERRMLLIQQAHAEDAGTDVGKVLKGLVKGSKLYQGEAKQVTEAFNSPDVEMLPPGQNRWRLSNAISLIAQKTKPDRQLELEEVAGEVAGLVQRAA